MPEIREALALAFLKSELPTDEVCRAMRIIDTVLAALNREVRDRLKEDTDG